MYPTGGPRALVYMAGGDEVGCGRAASDFALGLEAWNSFLRDGDWEKSPGRGGRGLLVLEKAVAEWALSLLVPRTPAPGRREAG